MGQLESVALPVDRHVVQRLETPFVPARAYQPTDRGERPAALARFGSAKVTRGDQHLSGVKVVERFLGANGGPFQIEPSASAIAPAARDTELRTAIAALRDRSCNPGIAILVGGPSFAADPGLADAVGADATAPNATTAVLVVRKLSDRAVPTASTK